MRLTSFLVIWIVGTLISPSLWATTVLSHIQNKGGSSFHLLFNGKVAQDQVLTEYFNDIIQFSIKDVSVYPAKMTSVEGSVVSKIFAYQYSPRLVRCRFTVKGKAEDFRGKFKIGAAGKSMEVQVERTAPPAQVPSPASVSAPEHSRVLGRGFPLVDEKDEKALLKRVLTSNPAQAQGVQDGSAEELAHEKSTAEKASLPLGGAKPLPSMGSAFLKLGGLVLLLLGVALLLKKIKTPGSAKKAGILGAISRFAHSGLGKEGKIIEVVSTHHLDPKKSIAVVRIAGRLLVVGVSNDSINLITQLSEGSESDFDSLLDSEKVKPALPPPSMAGMDPGVRSRIRSRLEGLKPL